jgi:glycosyltransferase involved in cell wall biosynthesis
VIVDSASRHPAAIEHIAARAGVRLVRCAAPGVSRARNAGAAATSAPMLAFTDDDCRPQPGWTAALDRAFVDPRVGLVTGRILPDRTGGRVVSVVLDDQPRDLRAGDDPASAGSGANMAFRRDAFTAVGGFDDEFGPGARFRAAEDHELFWRVLRAGWLGRFTPDAVVVHEQWRSLGAFLAANVGYGFGSGALAAKVGSVDAMRGRALLRAALVEKGVGRAFTHLRSGYELGALAALLTASGVATGAARAARHRWSAVPSGQPAEGPDELGGHIGP